MCTTYSLERRRCKVDGNHCEKITNVQQRSAVDSRRCLTIDTQAAAGSRVDSRRCLTIDTQAAAAAEFVTKFLFAKNPPKNIQLAKFAAEFYLPKNIQIFEYCSK